MVTALEIKVEVAVVIVELSVVATKILLFGKLSIVAGEKWAVRSKLGFRIADDDCSEKKNSKE